MDDIRAELEARRDRARATIAGLAKTPERGTAQGFGKRIGDGTVEAISRLTDIGVGTSLEAALERTERALAKLDEGTYGRCDVCGEPIAREAAGGDAGRGDVRGVRVTARDAAAAALGLRGPDRLGEGGSRPPSPSGAPRPT